MLRHLLFLPAFAIGCESQPPPTEPLPPAPPAAPIPGKPVAQKPKPGPLTDDPFLLWTDRGQEAGSLVPGPCFVSLDSNGDGFPDRRAEYEYDTVRQVPFGSGPGIRAARLRSRAIDTDGDGLVDRRYTSLVVSGWAREVRITEAGRGGVDWRVTDLYEVDRQPLGDGTTRAIWRRQISRGSVDRRSVEAVLDDRGRVLARRESAGTGAAEETSFSSIRCTWGQDGRVIGATRESWVGLSNSGQSNSQDDLAKCKGWDPRNPAHVPALWEPWTETAPRPIEGFGKDPPRDRPERTVYDFHGNPLLIMYRSDRWFFDYSCWKR